MSTLSESESEIYERLYRAIARQESRPGIHVTDLVYDCLRRGYYRIKYGHGFFNLKTLLRFFIGRAVHDYPILSGHEVELELDGVKGSADDFDPEKGILFEKKHTANTRLPLTPYPWHVRQVEFYYMMLKKAGYDVKKCYVVYIDVVTPRIKPIRVNPRSVEEIYEEFSTRRTLLEYYLKENRPPPRVVSNLCELCTFAIPCFNPSLQEILDSLKIDLGKRPEKAKHITVKDLVVKDDISAIAVSETEDKEYAVYISKDDFTCSCLDQKMRKVPCKHVIAVLMEVVSRGIMTYEEVGEYLRRWKNAYKNL